jgi:hypothetical protein
MPGLVCRAGSGRPTSRTPSMYVDEKSDEAILPEKRLNNGGSSRGSRGGKGLTQGNQPLGGRGSDTEPKCCVDPNDGCAAGDERDESFIARRLTRGRSPVR